MTLKLEQARKIIATAFKKSAEMNLKPLTVAVLDAGGAVVALERSDGSSRMRPEIAAGKANGAIALGRRCAASSKRRAGPAPITAASTAPAGGSDRRPEPRSRR